ncbi:hypothetical protein MHYP_G00177070 [Metynnis hypsauchen]
MNEDTASRQRSRASAAADPGKGRCWLGGWPKFTGAEAPDSSTLHSVMEFTKQQLQQQTQVSATLSGLHKKRALTRQTFIKQTVRHTLRHVKKLVDFHICATY